MKKKWVLNIVDLMLFLAESDVITLHVPLTEETRHMINKDSFAKMKKGAFLVNTARGPVVNERDMVEALQGRTAWGGGTGCF